MKITKTEIKNHIEGKDIFATYYGGLAGLNLRIYEVDDSKKVVYFVTVAGTKETPKKSKSSPTMTEEPDSAGDIELLGSMNV